MNSPLRPGRGGLLLAVRVTPKSSFDGVVGLHGCADGAVSLAVKVTASPDKGKANKAVTRLLADWTGLTKSSFSIASGEADRHKSFLVTGNTVRLEALIAALMLDRKVNGEDH